MQGLYDPREEHDACGIGMTVDVQGRQSHDIVHDGLTILRNLTHRGAVGSDPETGDGAGLMIQIPDRFFRNRVSQIDAKLPEQGQYAVGTLFFPKNSDAVSYISLLERIAAENGCRLLGVRDVPIQPDRIGVTARSLCPDVKQVFLTNPGLDETAFERRLFIVRRLFEKAVHANGYRDAEQIYCCGLSSNTLIYKGMLTAEQLPLFYTDVVEEDMASAIAVVHQRFSTNTFPNWSLAQPMRKIAHNGEINTIRGNVDRRLSVLEILDGVRRHDDDVWGDDMEKILPIFNDLGASDSALFDNMFELLVLSGRSMAHAMLMMMPQAWGERYHLGRDYRGFLEYHATFMEPWDGPAAMVFCDGHSVGSVLDRNGLRPIRYCVTKNDRVVLASETGVLPLDPEDVLEYGNVEPGQMFLVDTIQKRIVSDMEIKAKTSRCRPYRRWVEANRVALPQTGASGNMPIDPETLRKRQLAFGYTREELEMILRPMYEKGGEPVGSMGFDVPLAVLSPDSVLLFDYFKQRFAQVTNPPIDPIREKLLMSTTSFIGPVGSPLTEHPEYAHRLKLSSPIMTPLDLQKLFSLNDPSLVARRIDITYDSIAENMESALASLSTEAEKVVENGCGILVLSDIKANQQCAAIPSLLAVSAVGRHLMKKGMRGKTGIILESAEPRQVHHFAMLLTCGVDAVCPWLAMETIAHEMTINGTENELQHAIHNYIKAVDTGLLKIFSKMGICTIRSYRHTLSCEAIGIAKNVIDQYFGPIPSRVGGIGLREIEGETIARHDRAWRAKRGGFDLLPTGGEIHNRKDGASHYWSSEAVRLLQLAVRENDQGAFDQFSQLINRQTDHPSTLRGLIDFDTSVRRPVPLEEVEPVESLMKRFVTGAMSFGSLSREAHETMAIAMNRIGARSNSGEGGEDSARYPAFEDNDNRCSGTKQVASGRFGVTIEYLASAKEIQIKMAQGAKPGEGGHLPGYKVNREIAGTRHSTPGVSLISPPPHHDIYSIEDLAQLIYDLKNANPSALVNVKLVSIAGVGTIAAGVAKGKADRILISGYDGGTGAAPLGSIKNAGIPWELGLAETQQTLVKNNLRGRVLLQTDGQLRTGRDVAIAALLGAEEFGFGTAALVCLGCVLMRKCHQNICPAGIATQDPKLRSRFSGKPEHLLNYFRFVAEELRVIMASLGFRNLREMVGHSEILIQRRDIRNDKASTLDLTPIFAKPDVPDVYAISHRENQVLDGITAIHSDVMRAVEESLETSKPVRRRFTIGNTDRTVGTNVSHKIVKKFGSQGLPEDTIRLIFEGTAGQSFGAFAAPGLTLILNGTANDYLGKGLSGGKIIVRFPQESDFDASMNTIAGKTLFYGATSGEAYIAGKVGERFCVRNSGAKVVVEGCGDHGCEYMTGGQVAILGKTGINFAAGMSGGVAYVYDPDQQFDLKCNLEMVDLEPVLLESDEATLYEMIQKHWDYTESALARKLLEHWEKTKTLFVKVMPMEYRAALGLTNPVDLQSRKTQEENIILA